MQKIVSLALAVVPLIFASGKELVPTADGTTWLYEMTQETGKKFAFSDAKPGPDGKVHRLAAYRINGTQEVNGKILLKFEMICEGVITNTDLMTVDEHGISCAARVDQYGELTKLDPTQTMIAAPTKKISVIVGKGPMGGSTNQFREDTPKIYARWQGRGLREQAKIRVVWIAEKVADVPPNYTIDEATAIADSRNAHGTFTLARPDTGWAPGDYRVDFYLDAELADTAKLKITK